MTDQVQQLSADEIRAQMREIAARELNTSLDDALARLDSGELDERIVSSRLRLLRYLLGEEAPIDQAAE